VDRTKGKVKNKNSKIKKAFLIRHLPRQGIAKGLHGEERIRKAKSTFYSMRRRCSPSLGKPTLEVDKICIDKAPLTPRLEGGGRCDKPRCRQRRAWQS
jgi:hypothetical protein